jgi:hypothetical protein
MSNTKARLATAAVGGMLLAGGTGMIALAPAAHAADPVKIKMACVVPPGVGLEDFTDFFNFTVEVPTKKVAPGGVATLSIDMGATPVMNPLDLPEPTDFDFSVAMEAATSGGSTEKVNLAGAPGKITLSKLHDPIVLPKFEAKFTVPADATGDIAVLPSKLVLTAAMTDTTCTPETSTELAKIPVDKDGKPPTSPPPSSKPPTTPPATSSASSTPSASSTRTNGPAGPPNGKEVAAEYTCKTVVEGFPVKIPDTTPTYNVTVTVPSTAGKGDSLDISAKFKDNLVGKAPSSLPMDNISLTFTPTFKVDVEQGSNKKSVDLTAPSKTVTVNKGDDLILDGPVTGKFDVWGGGDYSFKPGELKIATVAKVGGLNAKSTTTCSINKTTVSATLVAEGDKGAPPAETTTSVTQSVEAPANPGDLASTGAEGDGMTAFAMAAGTAVLGAIALMLFVPYRRRMRNQV